MMWMTPAQHRRLGRACAALLPLGKVYHVGSSLTHAKGDPPPRDIDLRMLLDGGEYAKHTDHQWRVLADFIARALEAETGVTPIDFQVQEVASANAEFPGPRSAIFLTDELDGGKP